MRDLRQDAALSQSNLQSERNPRGSARHIVKLPSTEANLVRYLCSRIEIDASVGAYIGVASSSLVFILRGHSIIRRLRLSHGK